MSFSINNNQQPFITSVYPEESSNISNASADSQSVILNTSVESQPAASLKSDSLNVRFPRLNAALSGLKSLTAGIETLKQIAWSAYKGCAAAIHRFLGTVSSTNISTIIKKYGQSLASTYKSAFLSHGKTEDVSSKEIQSSFEKLPPQDETITLLSQNVTTSSELGYYTDEFSPQSGKALLPADGFVRIYGQKDRDFLLEQFHYAPNTAQRDISSLLTRTQTAVEEAKTSVTRAEQNPSDELALNAAKDNLTEAETKLAHLQRATEGYEKWEPNKLAAFVAIHDLLDSVSEEVVNQETNNLTTTISQKKSLQNEDFSSFSGMISALKTAQENLENKTVSLKQVRDEFYTRECYQRSDLDNLIGAHQNLTEKKTLFEQAQAKQAPQEELSRLENEASGAKTTFDALQKNLSFTESKLNKLIDTHKTLIDAETRQKEARTTGASQDELAVLEKAVSNANSAFQLLEKRDLSLTESHLNALINALEHLIAEKNLLKQAQADKAPPSQLKMLEEAVSNAQTTLDSLREKTPENLKQENEASIATQEKLLTEIPERAKRIKEETAECENWNPERVLSYCKKETMQQRLIALNSKIDRVRIKIGGHLVPCSSRKSIEENVELFTKALKAVAPDKTLSEEAVKEMLLLVDQENITRGFPSGADLETGLSLGATPMHSYDINVFEITPSPEGAFDFNFDFGRAYMTTLQTPVEADPLSRVSITIGNRITSLKARPTPEERKTHFHNLFKGLSTQNSSISSDSIDELTNKFCERLEKLNLSDLNTTKQALQELVGTGDDSLKIEIDVSPHSTSVQTSNFLQLENGDKLDFSQPETIPGTVSLFETSKKFTYRYTPSSSPETEGSVQLTDSRIAYWPIQNPNTK